MKEDPSAETPHVRDQVKRAVSTARDQAGQLVSRGRETVSDYPGVSLASVFAAGVVVGALVAIATRPEPRPALPAANAREGLVNFFSSLAENLREPIGRTYDSAADQATQLSSVVKRAVDAIQEKKKSWW